MTMHLLTSLLLLLVVVNASTLSRTSRNIGGVLYDHCHVMKVADQQLVKVYWNRVNNTTLTTDDPLHFTVETDASNAFGFLALQFSSTSTNDQAAFIGRISPITGLYWVREAAVTNEGVVSVKNETDDQTIQFMGGSIDNEAQVLSMQLRWHGFPTSLLQESADQLAVSVLLDSRFQPAAENSWTWADQAVGAPALQPLTSTGNFSFSRSDRSTFCAHPDDPEPQAGASCPAGAVVSGTVAFDDKLSCAWDLDCDQQLAAFRLTFAGGLGAATGWAAVGFSADRFMASSDVVMCRIDDAMEAVVEDRWASSQAEPAVDASDDLSDAAVSVDGDSVTFSWTRPFDTGDQANDYVLDPADSSPHLLYAYHASAASFSVQHTATGALPLNVFAGGSATAPEAGFDLKWVHGALLLLAWVGIVPATTFLARFLKDLGHAWFLWHRGLNILVFLLTVGGIVVAYAAVGLDNPVHWRTPHSIVGLAVAGLTLLQGILGHLADKLWSPDRKGTPICPDISHAWLGRLLLLTGAFNCVYGVLLYQGGNFLESPYVSPVAVSLSILLALVCLVLGECWLGAVHHNASTDSQPGDFEMSGASTGSSNPSSPSKEEATGKGLRLLACFSITVFILIAVSTVFSALRQNFV